MQTDREAGFFKNFSSGNWSPNNVNGFIQEAAHCTYRVRDIRDELHLLRQVFETQAKVVADFAAIFWPSSTPGSQKQGHIASKDLRESFIRDCGLQSLIQRVRRMESDASTTLEGVSVRAGNLSSSYIVFFSFYLNSVLHGCTNYEIYLVEYHHPSNAGPGISQGS